MDLTLALKVDQCADRILDRYPVIDRMQLVELEAFEPQPSQAVCAGATQVIRPTVSHPAVGTGSCKPTLCGHHELCRVGMERLCDQGLADRGATRIGGIDKGDAPIHDPPEQHDCLSLIPRRTPHLRPGDAHRAEAKISNRQLSGGGWG